MVLAHPSFLDLEFLKSNAESHLIKLVSIHCCFHFVGTATVLVSMSPKIPVTIIFFSKLYIAVIRLQGFMIYKH